MAKASVFIGEPLYYREKDLYIHIPKLKEVVGNPNYPIYSTMFTTSQEDLWDLMAEKEGKRPDGKPIENCPTPFEFLLINCKTSPNFETKMKEAFYFWTHKHIRIYIETKTILITDGIDKIKEAKDLTTIQEKDYFTFQNIIRQALGEKPLEPPKENENPKIALIKAKGRYRERIKKKKGNKNGISLDKIIVIICCMGIGITPLNIGEIPYPAISMIFEKMQEKEKYETDLKVATAGFGNKKIKPKYWIHNEE